MRLRVAGFRGASGLDGSVTLVDMKAPRTVRGKVTSVDKAKREVRMTDRESGGAVTIHLPASAKIRTIPRFVARSIAVGGTLHPEGAGLGAGGFPEGYKAAKFELASGFEKFPESKLDDIKPGVAVVACGTIKGLSMTATRLVLGAEPLLTGPPSDLHAAN